MGFFGAALSIVFLPRILRYSLRNILSKIVGQLLLLITLGIVSEMLTRRKDGNRH